jgi:hypothetical protein
MTPIPTTIVSIYGAVEGKADTCVYGCVVVGGKWTGMTEPIYSVPRGKIPYPAGRYGITEGVSSPLWYYYQAGNMWI